MRLSIRKKLFILLAGFTAVVLVVVLLVLRARLESAIEAKITADFTNTQVNFHKELVLRYNHLLESALLIGENSTFKANVTLEDPPSVHAVVSSLFAPLIDSQFFIVTDRKGRVLTRLDDPETHGDDISGQPGVARALDGEYPEPLLDQDDWPLLWLSGERVYQTVTVPVYKADTVIGTLTLGDPVTTEDAFGLKGDTNIDITFLAGERVIGTTLDELTVERARRFYRERRALVDQAVSSMRPTAAYEGEYRGEAVFAFVSPVGKGQPVYYVATVRRADELAILDELEGYIYVTALVSLLATVALALALGRTLSQPVLRLVEGMNRVREGDLEVELKATTRDEIGLLTRTFNDMIGSLRERLHLMRYVGSHTQQMIREASDTEVHMEGRRCYVAMLFSDIRGFTAYSENREPEDVIAMLNRYLGFQARIVPEYGGSIDKFVGDEMVALFMGDDGLRRALECALAIQRSIAAEQAKDEAPVAVGIGVNAGQVILGNMGAENRLDYTVIGAEVNLCARLCGSAEAGEVLVRSELLAGLDVPVKVRETRSLRFKNISEPLEIASVYTRD